MDRTKFAKLDMNKYMRDVKLTEGVKYSVYKNDGDSEPVEVDADDDDDAMDKIKKITGKDPKDVTYYKNTNEINTTDSVFPHDGPAFDHDDEVMEDNVMFERFYRKINEALTEVTYKDFATDQTSSTKQKVNGAIRKINSTLYELERLVSHASKLKTEAGLSQDSFWKSTNSYFGKISERLLRISNKVREFNK